jgi:hypothetical protein
MASPTSRTLEYYRSLGMTIEVTEKWNQFSRQRNDMFGFADLCAFDHQNVYLIQATSTGNMRAREAKILGVEAARLWVQSPNRKIVVIGWKKYAKPVDRKLWRPTIREMTVDDWK